MASLYSTKVTASGGRHGSIRSEDGLLDLKLALPRALGGRGDATNPEEQLFAGGYAACFENALLHVSREAFPWNEAPRYMIRDRDRIYGAVVTRRLRAMGIRDKPTAPASPWQNGFAERLIGSIRRECMDHIVVLGEAHLRRVLRSYASDYNEIRTHRSLNKHAPVSRPVQRTGTIKLDPILGGLHHHYVRV